MTATGPSFGPTDPFARIENFDPFANAGASGDPSAKPLESDALAGIDALRPVIAGESTLGLGARGPAVVAVQDALVALGYPAGPADGIFGRGTERLVAQFRKDEGLDAGAEVDEATIHALDERLLEASDAADASGAPSAPARPAPPATTPARPALPVSRPIPPSSPPSLPVSRPVPASPPALPVSRPMPPSAPPAPRPAPAPPAPANGSPSPSTSSGPHGADRLLDESTGGIAGRDLEFAELARFVGGARGVAVAVVDDGVELGHALLANNRGASPGWDFVHGRAESDGTTGWHGTAVSSIAAYGTDQVKILPEEALAATAATGSPPDLSEVVAYARARGARVVNMSWTTPDAGDAASMREAMRRNPDMLFVAAAGNDGADIDAQPTYPASLREPNQIVVANLGRDGRLAESSNFGARSVHVAAVGMNVMTAADAATDPAADCASDDTACTAPHSGTSFSAPFVSNVAAKLVSLCPTLTALEVKRLILDTADRSAELAGAVSSGGTINALRTYRAAAALARVAQGSGVDAAVGALPGAGPVERARLATEVRAILAARG